NSVITLIYSNYLSTTCNFITLIIKYSHNCREYIFDTADVNINYFGFRNIDGISNDSLILYKLFRNTLIQKYRVQIIIHTCAKLTKTNMPLCDTCATFFYVNRKCSLFW